MKSTNALALGLGRFLSLIVGLVAVPLTYKWLGKEAFGVYAWAGSASLLVGLIDIGFFMGASKLITQAFHRKENAEALHIHDVQHTLGTLMCVGGILLWLLIGALVPPGALGRPAVLFLAGALGVQFAATWYLQYLAAYTTSRDLFALQATVSFLTNFLGNVLGPVFCYFRRDVLALSFGNALGNVLGLAIGLAIVKARDRDFRLRWSLDRRIVGDLAREGIKMYLNRLTGVLAYRTDRLLLGAYSPAMAGQYQIAGRPIEVLSEQLNGAVDTTQPEILRKALDGVSSATAVLERNATVIWTLGCCLMVVPCAFGGQVLRLWMHQDLFAGAGILMICWALNTTSDSYYRSFGPAYVANGTLYRSAWFPLANAALTFVLTIPVVRAFGLVGVGVMNAVISMSQFGFRIAQANQELHGHFPVRRHILKCAAIFGVALVFASGGYALSLVTPDWAALVLGPIFAVGSLTVCIKLRISPVPGILPKLRAKLFRVRKPRVAVEAQA